MASFKNNIDEALSMVGYGRWQIPFLLLTLIIQFLVPVHLVGSTLFSVPLPFRCFSSPDAPLEATTTSHFSSTTTTTHPPTVTYEETTSHFSATTTTTQPSTVNFDSRCVATDQNASLPLSLLRKTNLPSCPYVEYDVSTFPSTVISEFNLICEKTSLRPLFQMVVSVGMLFASPLGGVISDKYGRKRIVIAGSVLNGAVVVLMALCPWYSVVLISRFVLGVTVSFLILPAFSLAQETTPPRLRSQSGMLAGLGFSVGVIALPGIAYLMRPWRYLSVTASSTLLVIIPLACYVDESPRWLAIGGRQKEAADALERAARRNRVSITPEFIAILEEIKMENSGSAGVEGRGKEAPVSGLGQCCSQCWNFLRYLRYPGLRRIVLITPAIWYLQTLIYMGIMLNANNFTSNNPFIYLAMLGALDFIALTLATPLTIYVGRRCLSGLLFFFAGILLLLDIAIPSELKWLKWVFVMTAFLLASAAYQIQFIYTPELFPTVIRSSGFGLSNGMGSLGVLTAPFITDVLVQKVWWAVNAACGSAGLLASVLILLLPETHNLPLPETLQDVERRLISEKGKRGSDKMVERTTNETIGLHKTEPLLKLKSVNSNLEMRSDEI